MELTELISDIKEENGVYNTMSSYKEVVVSLDLKDNSFKVEKVLNGSNIFFNLYNINDDWLYYRSIDEKGESYKKINMKTEELKVIDQDKVIPIIKDNEFNRSREVFHSGSKFTYAVNQPLDGSAQSLLFKTFDFDKEEVKVIDTGVEGLLISDIVCEDNKLYYTYEYKNEEYLGKVDIEKEKVVYKGKISRNLTIKNIKKIEGGIKMYFEVNDREPIYSQIIKHIKVSLVIGTLLPGDTIPSRRELAEKLRVNANTVQRAYKDMEGYGLIETVRNFPSKITTNEEVLNGIKSELIKDSVDVFIKSMKDLKIPKGEVVDIIEKNY